MDIPSFVINLKRRPDRLENFRENCPLKFTVIPGFDGRNFENESEFEKNMLKNFTCLSLGEIGCFISHIRVFQKIVDEGIQIALIMEDDAIFCKDFSTEYAKVIREIPENTDILYIGGRFEAGFKMSSGQRISERIVRHTNLVNDYDADRTAHAYIVSLRFAKYILEQFNSTSISVALDHWLIMLCILNNIQINSAFPLLCYSPIAGDSDIR